MQNKANFKMGNINISTAIIEAYASEQRKISNERYSKQRQSNPISNAKTAYFACRTRDCHGPAGLAMMRGYSAIPKLRLRLPPMAITSRGIQIGKVKKMFDAKENPLTVITFLGSSPVR
jgi:hypothetical protein